MNRMFRLSEALAVAGGEISAAAVDNTTIASPYVALATGGSVMFVVIAKDTNAAADTTIDAKVQSADDGSGTNVADITNLAITQFTAANASDKIAVIEVREDEVNAGDTHVRCLVTAGNGTAGANIAIIALQGNLDYLPATEYDSAEVQQVKTL